PWTPRGAEATVVSAYGNRRHGASRCTTRSPGAGTEMRSAAEKIQCAGDARRRATRRSSAAICNALLHRKRHVRKSGDALQPLQSAGTTRPAASVRKGVE